MEFPAFVSVTLNTLLFPIATFPKLKLDAVDVSSAVAPIPVPLKETVLGETETSLMTDTSPVSAPAAFGEKITSNVACFPAPSVKGSEMPVIATPVALVLACVTVRLDPPAFDMVTDWDAVLPTATDPKLTDAGATEIVAAPGVAGEFGDDAALGAEAKPVQPERNGIAKSGSASAAAKNFFRPAIRICDAPFPARSNHVFLRECFIAAIVVCGTPSGLLSQWPFKVQGREPAPACKLGGNQRTAH